MDAATLLERRDLDPATDGPWAGYDGAVPGSEWPTIDPGHGCKAFLRSLGVEDAVIAFTPPETGPRRLLIVGLSWLRRYPEQIRRLIRAAEEMWSPLTDRAVVIRNLGADTASVGDALAMTAGCWRWWCPPGPVSTGRSARQR